MSFNLMSSSNSTWRVPWNRSKPRRHMPCRRLLQRRDPAISRGRATAVAAPRGPTASSTECTVHGASKKIKAVANPVFYPSLFAPKPHEHRPGDDFAQKFDRCIRVAAGRVMGWRQPTQGILRAIASYPTLAKRFCRWPWRSGEEARRRSPRWLPAGVS